MSDREFRPTIAKVWTRQRVLSAEDVMNLNRVRFSISPFGKAKDSETYVFGFLTIDDALLVADAIINNQFTKLWPDDWESNTDKVVGKYKKYGGTKKSNAYGGKPESRIVEITAMQHKESGKARWLFELKAGEGKLTDNGGIQPKDSKMMARQFQYMSNEDMRRFMLMIDLHVRTYFAKYFETMYDETAKDVYSHDDRSDCFKSKFRSPAETSRKDDAEDLPKEDEVKEPEEPADTAAIDL